jgi:hypothetical protein
MLFAVNADLKIRVILTPISSCSVVVPFCKLDALGRVCPITKRRDQT